MARPSGGQLWDSDRDGHLLSLACGLRPKATAAGVLWPWLTEVHVTGDGVCAGILVAPGWVLAATHCILRWVSSSKEAGRVRKIG